MDEEQKQELVMRASLLQQQAEETEKHLQTITQEMHELQVFKENLTKLDKSEETKTFAAMGKGVYIEADLKDKKLLVDVGAGVLVRKTPNETRDVIDDQVKRLTEARTHLRGKMEIYQRLLQELIAEARGMEHEHDENCEHGHGHHGHEHHHGHSHKH